MQVPTHVYAKMPDGTIYHGLLIERNTKSTRIQVLDIERPGDAMRAVAGSKVVTVMNRSIYKQEKN